MTSTNSTRLTDQGPPLPAMGTLNSAANQFFAGGTIVQKDANGRAVSPVSADVSGLPAWMVAVATFDNRTNTNMFPFNGLDDGGLIEGTFGSHAFAFTGTTPLAGQPLFVVDNQTLSVDSLNGTRGPAGVCTQVQTVGTVTKAFCLFGPLGLAIIGALGTSHSRVALGVLGALVVSTGAVMAVFANSASTVPGTQMGDGSKSAVVRWNNDAAPGAISVDVPYPADLDDTQDVHFYAIMSKSGATVGDATSLTVAAFEVIPGALADADVDFGGVTTALVGNAAAKTVGLVALTLTAANVHAYPGVLNLQIKPTAGTLGTDDLLLHGAWIEFSRKAA